MPARSSVTRYKIRCFGFAISIPALIQVRDFFSVMMSPPLASRGDLRKNDASLTATIRKFVWLYRHPGVWPSKSIAAS
jgi:hypothetical protein